MEFNIGNKFTTEDGGVVMICQASRTGTRNKKISVVNIATGEILGRIVEVQDYKKIQVHELSKALGRNRNIINSEITFEDFTKVVTLKTKK